MFAFKSNATMYSDAYAKITECTYDDFWSQFDKFLAVVGERSKSSNFTTTHLHFIWQAAVKNGNALSSLSSSLLLLSFHSSCARNLTQ